MRHLEAPVPPALPLPVVPEERPAGDLAYGGGQQASPQAVVDRERAGAAGAAAVLRGQVACPWSKKTGRKTSEDFPECACLVGPHFPSARSPLLSGSPGEPWRHKAPTPRPACVSAGYTAATAFSPHVVQFTPWFLKRPHYWLFCLAGLFKCKLSGCNKSTVSHS